MVNRLILRILFYFKMSIKSFLSVFLARHVVRKNLVWKNNAVLCQQKMMRKLVMRAKNTDFGLDHSFSKIKTYNDFKKNIPLRDYEGLKPYINKIIAGKSGVLWPNKPIYFCKTSGTTSGSKFIPITKESMPFHLKAAKDAILTYILESKNTNIVNGKMIFLQGSPVLKRTGNILTGRLSGIVAHHIPFYLKKNRLPSYKTNCIDDWESKVDAIVEETINKKMSVISGIPPWVQMYFEKLQKKSGKLIGDLFPDFDLFIFGGVNYEPYKNTFEKLIGRKVDGLELYPASEGFIAYQDSQKEKGMLLCVNHGVFYEFIDVNDFFDKSPKRVDLSGVKTGVNYVIILNTNAGLWGYCIGDTVRFVSKDPYRIIVTGRIKHFTSAFGEHVIAEEVERSLKETLLIYPAEIKELHVAPQVNPEKGLPYHEWFIEFEKKPDDLEGFKNSLDVCLQNNNSYYRDLVSGGVLRELKITCVGKNGFIKFMKEAGKLGGQNKVPRLANDREIAEKINLYRE
tara:strand:+ start:382148 stop:383683 length:1536 start_codon:yes stop_codon:yes gene_type:complete